MTTVKHKVLLIALALMACPVFAGLHLEPFVSVGFGSGGDYNYTGRLIGGKIGHRSMLGFSTGLRYDNGGFNVENGEDEDSSHNALGAFVGYDFPLLFKVSGAYFFSSKQKWDREGARVKTNLEGTGYAVRAATGFIPFVDITFEYQRHEYDHENIKDPTTWYMVGLSLPSQPLRPWAMTKKFF